MLTRLKISNFVLIENLDLDIKFHLTVLTGETGSGKSILIDALMLIFGARITNNIIRHGATTTELLAEFELSNGDAINWLKENDLHNIENESHLVCRRRVDLDGKNKIYINSYPVTSTQIKLLGEFILDIHTQHAAITLLKQESQRKLVDEYAGISLKVTELGTLYKKMSTLQQEIQSVKANLEKSSALKNELELTYQELKALSLKVNEWQEIETRHRQIANLGVVLNELTLVQNTINLDEYSLQRGINSIKSSLRKIQEYLPQLDSINNIIESMAIEVNELNHDIGHLLKSIDVEPNELQALEERMEQIFAISRKYRITPEQIFAYTEQIEQQLATLGNDSTLTALEQQLQEIAIQYQQLAAIITQKRDVAVQQISQEVTKLLPELAITGYFQAILIKTNEPSIFGLENVEFLVAFNQGLPPQALGKVASGGELSRTALALYLLLSIKNSPETIIFDEIDVGIGGTIAAHIGKMLYTLGLSKQVLCITHQAQTASFGNNHLVISKKHNAQDNITHLNASYLEQNGRIQEIARMLGGVKITETTLKHAKEMLEHSQIT